MDKFRSKKSLWSRFLAFLSSVFNGGTIRSRKESSYFMHHLNDVDKNSEIYNYAVHVVELCDESVDIIRRRLALIERQKIVDENIAGVECFNKLTDDDAEKLKALLDSYASQLRDKSVLKNQLEGFDRSLMYMKSIEGDANNAVPNIEEAEKKQRLLRQDLMYLESEKSELEYERENLGAGLKFTYTFSLVIVIVFGVAILSLGYSYFYMGNNILMPAAIVISLAILLAAAIYVFRRRIRFELSLNTKKQQRAGELINKKTAVYAHYTNFLNYEYNKYKVRNSDMLKETINDYSLYKHLHARLEAIRKLMYQTEGEIERFLDTRQLNDVVTTIESFAKTVDIGDKRNYYRELAAERNKIEIRLSELDQAHIELWDKLSIYQQAGLKDDGLIDTVIKACIDETGRIINDYSGRGETEPEDEFLTKDQM